MHDITSFTQPGPNAIGLYIGNGMWVSKGGGEGPTVRAKIVIEYTTSSSASPQQLTLVTRGVPPPLPSNHSCSTCASAPERGTANLKCPNGGKISKVNFASFGTPPGECYGHEYSYVADPMCDAGPEVLSAIESFCIGHPTCDVMAHCAHHKCVLDLSHARHDVQNKTISLGSDPCSMVEKHIAIAVECGGKTDEQSENYPAPPGYTWLAAVGPYRGTANGGRAGQSDDPFAGSVTDWSVFQQPTVWSSPGYKPPANGSNAWTPVLATAKTFTPGGELRSLSMPLSQLISTLKPVATPPGDKDANTFLNNGSSLRCKFARNFVGTVRVDTSKLLKPTAKDTPGVTLSLKHGEVLAEDG